MNNQDEVMEAKIQLAGIDPRAIQISYAGPALNYYVVRVNQRLIGPREAKEYLRHLGIKSYRMVSMRSA